MHSEWGNGNYGCNICLLKRIMFIICLLKRTMFIVCSIIMSGDDHCG
jgi:hypothetical protein